MIKTRKLAVLMGALLLSLSLAAGSVNASVGKVFSDQGVGGSQSLLLTSEGKVISFGDNGMGQLGVGNSTTSPVPQVINGLTDVVAVSSGVNFSLALKSDGTVWAWGTNSMGQLGDGTKTKRLSPVKVSGLTNVIAITSSGSHSMALKSDGTVWSFGGNGSGELGLGNNTSYTTPQQIPNFSNVASITSGNYHSVAVKNDGTVWVWGSNIFGQLGDGKVGVNFNASSPKQVAGLTNVVNVNAGIGHNLALKSDGTVWAWGDNSQGQLGDGTKTRRMVPTKIPSHQSFVAVGAGGYSSFGLKENGTLWAWGNNNAGQLGIGTAGAETLERLGLTGTVAPIIQISSPRQIASDVRTISIVSQHAFAIKTDNTVIAWGKNEFGQLGDGTYTFRITPSVVFSNTSDWDY
ncbi:RCC1 domain-containing protein [Paenibacillus oryzae]|uniref:RCC1 domain-containing protein n=1 Tax=Paenibacillus oryzae TaxID=1844972 RepID=UPI0009ECD1E8|nr:hypothetical protein [Paenibacillus oryzae]